MLKFKWLDGDVRFFFKISYHSEHVTIVLHVNIVMSACWLSRYVDTFDGKITSTKGAQKYVTINLASFFTSTFGEFQTGLIKKKLFMIFGEFKTRQNRIITRTWPPPLPSAIQPVGYRITNNPTHVPLHITHLCNLPTGQFIVCFLRI